MRVEYIKDLYSPFIAGDRWLAGQKGGVLRLFDLEDLERPVLVVPKVVSYNLLSTHLVIRDTSQTVTCWGLMSDEWHETAKWTLSPPEDLGAGESADSNDHDDVALSPSGHYLITAGAVWDTWAGLRQFDVGGYAEFARLPDGREMVLSAVDDLYGLALWDCESSAMLQRYYLPGEEDFIHRGFLLSPDARRLLSVGCYWACPWGIRMYDFTPWLPEAGSLTGGDLPLLFEDYDGVESLSSISAYALTESTYTVFGYVDLAAHASIDYDMESIHTAVSSGRERMIFTKLSRLKRRGHQAAVVARVIELHSGALRSFTVAPFEPTGLWRGMHQLRGAQLLLLSSRVKIFDGKIGTISDRGAFARPKDAFETAATSDGQLLVVVSNKPA
jgi:hypothetical protein